MIIVQKFRTRERCQNGAKIKKEVVERVVVPFRRPAMERPLQLRLIVPHEAHIAQYRGYDARLELQRLVACIESRRIFSVRRVLVGQGLSYYKGKEVLVMAMAYIINSKNGEPFQAVIECNLATPVEGRPHIAFVLPRERRHELFPKTTTVLSVPNSNGGVLVFQPI